MSRVALVTGATRNLGLALVQGLALRLDAADTVYLTGRDSTRVSQALELVCESRADVRGETLDVSDGGAVARLVETMRERHGGIDIVFSNAYRRVEPTDDPAGAVEAYAAVNNLGTTNMLRSFVPALREGGRLLVVASTLGTLHYLPPALHHHFEPLESLDEIDHAVTTWTEAVRDGSAGHEAWPGWINVPSKVAQVAAVRVLAGHRRREDLSRNILIAAVCPGLIDTGASRPWIADMSQAITPDQAAGPLLRLALEPEFDRSFYGELVRFGEVLPWKP